MPFRALTPLVVVSFLSLFATFGCSSGTKESPVAPISGSVSYLGKPVQAGVITFSPTNGGPSAQGRIQQGRIVEVVTVSQSSERAGAPLGEHRVTCRAGTGSLDGDVGMQEHLPEIYNSISKSPLLVVVEAGKDNTFQFDLTAKPEEASVVIGDGESP